MQYNKKAIMKISRIDQLVNKLKVEGINKENFTTEKAVSILERCVGKLKLVQELKNNERQILNQL